MGKIVKMYKDNFLQRFDKEEGIPYYEPSDFVGLLCKEDSFNNSVGINIKYFLYNYEKYDDKKLILFCPGIGPGHTAYLKEIATFCEAGYQVLTLDYSGCGASGGDNLYSINAPTKDAIELLELLKIEKEIIVIGHSLGGYTALNVINLLDNIKKAVIISGFISISDELIGFVKLRLLTFSVKRFEKKIDPKYGAMNNIKYIKNTSDDILWIHSTDDPLVNYKYNGGRIKKLNRPNIKLITAEGKKHNPQYTYEALQKMNKWISEYNQKLRQNELKTIEDKKAFFNDKPIEEMTKQDDNIYKDIFSFLAE